MPIAQPGAARYGQLKQIGAMPDLEQSPQVQRTRYRWSPSELTTSYLPPGFSVDFTCLECEGERRLVPDLAMPAFLGRASLAGLAILRSRSELSHEEVSTYHTMQLLFQLSSQLRERLDRRLKVFDDLRVRNSDTGFTDIVPEGVGMGDGNGCFWNVRKLLAEGREAAEVAGVEAPDLPTCLAYGIDRDARQRPVDLDQITPQQVERRLRQVLFDAGPIGALPDPNLKVRVYGRLADAVEPHLADTDADFNTWFFLNLDNIIHQISKRRKPDGPINREHVRQTMLELVYDSWSYVGQCVSLLMRSVRSGFQPPLTSTEQAVFDAVYQRNPYLGNVPLVLLSDQFPMLQPTVTSVLEHPEQPTSWGRLHRALETYAFMLGQRREADRVAKQVVPLSLFQPDEIGVDSSSHDDTDQGEVLREIIKKALQRDGVNCRCAGDSNWEIQFSPADGDPQNVQVFATCNCCQFEHQRQIPIITLQEIARQDELAD